MGRTSWPRKKDYENHPLSAVQQGKTAWGYHVDNDNESEVPGLQGPTDRWKRENLRPVRRHRRSDAAIGGA